MSYDIELRDKDGDVIRFAEPHHLKGGTYSTTGTHEAWLNVTYNYGKHFRRVLDGEKGIRLIYGMTGQESIAVLEKGIAALNDDVDESDYWNPTEGNARRALENLLTLAKAAPHGVWDGD